MRETFHAACYINMLVLLVVTVIVCCIGSDAFTPQPQHVKVASTNTHIKVDCSTRTENEDEAPRIERIRAAVFQPPAPSDTNNPLSILTQVADSLRIASLHGVDMYYSPNYS